MTLDRRIEVLCHAFPSLREDTLTYVAQNAREVRVAAGDRICEEGEAGDAFYLILAGRVQVSKRLQLGTQRLLTELLAGPLLRRTGAGGRRAARGQCGRA